MDRDYYKKLADSMNAYSGDQRQHLVSGYVFDTFDDEALTKMPAVFFAELLKNEKDNICKWYEIQAIGRLRATEYSELLVFILSEPDVRFESGTSLHLITAKSLGLMGETIIPQLEQLWNEASSQTRISIIDTLGEIGGHNAADLIEKLLPSLNRKEFANASLSLSKCGIYGYQILQKSFSLFSHPDQLFCIIDALCYSSNNDDFLKHVLCTNEDLLVRVLTSQTRGSDLLQNRINNCDGIWTETEKTQLQEKGVNFK